MAVSIHKGITLDDNFTKAMRSVQNGIESLEDLATKYEESGIRPVNSHVFKLTVAVEDLEKLKAIFKRLND